jgi:hypothetical protein
MDTEIKQSNCYLCKMGDTSYIEYLFMFFVFVYVYWCPTRFPYQMMFVSFSRNKTGVTSGAVTTYFSEVPEFTLGFTGVHVAQYLVFYVVFCRLLLYFSHCVVCPSLYVFRLPLWYLQLLLFNLNRYNYKTEQSLSSSFQQIILEWVTPRT